ncbi:MAG: DUF2397 family protein, partial [Rhodococcus sp. (in: high G+C Gram-positive bacteria)]
PVEISRTLAETGRPPAAGAPARVQRNDAGVRRLRERQLDAQRRRSDAAGSLAENGVYERALSSAETDVLLGLLNAALTARVPVSGRVGTSAGSDAGVTLTVAPHERSTVVQTDRGLLHLDKLSLTIGARR